MVALTTKSLNQLNVDVTLTQYRSLVVLASKGPQRTADLAAELGVGPSSVTRLGDRLVRRGLVQRRQDEGDRRVTWIALSESGKDLVGAAMRQRRELLARAVSGLPASDVEAAAPVLARIAEAAGEPADPQWWESWSRSAQL